MKHTHLLSFSAHHPALAGHFPGTPLVPGVLLLARAQSIIERSTGLTLIGLVQAKFIRPVTPELILTFDFTLDTKQQQVAFTYRTETTLMSRGQFRFSFG